MKRLFHLLPKSLREHEFQEDKPWLAPMGTEHTHADCINGGWRQGGPPSSLSRRSVWGQVQRLQVPGSAPGGEALPAASETTETGKGASPQAPSLSVPSSSSAYSELILTVSPRHSA